MRVNQRRNHERTPKISDATHIEIVTFILKKLHFICKKNIQGS